MAATLPIIDTNQLLNIPMNPNKIKASSLFATILLAGSLGLTACSSEKKPEATKPVESPAATTGASTTETKPPTGAMATGTAMAISAADKLKLTACKNLTKSTHWVNK